MKSDVVRELFLYLYLNKYFTMRRFLYSIWSIVFLLVISSCNSSSDKTKTETTGVSTGKVNLVDGHPDWIMRGNIYEVNVRQYTPEGTFKAFEKHLFRRSHHAWPKNRSVAVRSIGRLFICFRCHARAHA